METLKHIYENAAQYPRNLKNAQWTQFSCFTLDEIYRQFQGYGRTIFCDEECSVVKVLHISHEAGGDQFQTVNRERQLDELLLGPMRLSQNEPLNRIFYVCAPNSRSPLYISAKMAQKLFSYYQVIPTFVGSLSAFGFREHGQDCMLSSLVCEIPLTGMRSGLRVDTIGWSGRQMKLCYDLRAVEPSSAQEDWPWSIRQSSVFHTLDLESAQAAWIIIKANSLMKFRIKEATDNPKYRSWLQRDNVSAGLAAAMTIHNAIAAWCGTRDWTSYIEHMEVQLQKTTRHTLSVDVATRVPPNRNSPAGSHVLSAGAEDEKDDLKRQQSAFRRAETTIRAVGRRAFSWKSKTGTADIMDEEEIFHHRFSFKDLRRVHYIQERAVEAYDTLRNNSEVLENLRKNYLEIVTQLEERKTDEEAMLAFQSFSNDMDILQKQLQLAESRVGMLLRLLGERKSLLKSILDYESMAANRVLAEKAHSSALKMEHLAVKTKLETVLMRIITVVTLFFLPGTFISTLMSTTVVSFEPGSRSFLDGKISWGAVSFFLTCSLPLLLITLGVSFMVYRKEYEREKSLRVRWQQREAAGLTIS